MYTFVYRDIPKRESYTMPSYMEPIEFFLLFDYTYIDYQSKEYDTIEDMLKDVEHIKELTSDKNPYIRYYKDGERIWTALHLHREARV